MDAVAVRVSGGWNASAAGVRSSAERAARTGELVRARTRAYGDRVCGRRRAVVVGVSVRGVERPGVLRATVVPRARAAIRVRRVIAYVGHAIAVCVPRYRNATGRGPGSLAERSARAGYLVRARRARLAHEPDSFRAIAGARAAGHCAQCENKPPRQISPNGHVSPSIPVALRPLPHDPDCAARGRLHRLRAPQSNMFAKHLRRPR